jgi:hypothetical protein
MCLQWGNIIAYNVHVQDPPPTLIKSLQIILPRFGDWSDQLASTHINQQFQGIRFVWTLSASWESFFFFFLKSRTHNFQSKMLHGQNYVGSTDTINQNTDKKNWHCETKHSAQCHDGR